MLHEAALGQALEPDLARLLDRGQRLVDQPLSEWSWSRGKDPSQLFAGHALTHTADALRCARPMILAGEVVAASILLRNIQENLLLVWYFGLHPDKVEDWVEGRAPSTDYMWLEASQAIPMMRPEWSLFSELRDLLNALVHATRLALQFIAEAPGAHDPAAQARAIRPGGRTCGTLVGVRRLDHVGGICCTGSPNASRR